MSKIFVEDHVVPQLFTSAIEAYEFHKTPRGKLKFGLETFGLLWGYSIQAKGNNPAKIIATLATVETSATNHTQWVQPDFDCLRMKKNFFTTYWPHIELVGSFHSHPYDSLADINRVNGWQASPGDKIFFPEFHKEIAPEQENLAHLIVAITTLRTDRNTPPRRLPRGESTQGYIISAEWRRFWLRAYGSNSNFDSTTNTNTYTFSDENSLDIPSMEMRFT